MEKIALIISIAYQQASQTADLASFYQTWGTNDFIMTNLPWIVGIFGFVSGIILFVITQTSSEQAEEETRRID